MWEYIDLRNIIHGDMYSGPLYWGFLVYRSNYKKKKLRDLLGLHASQVSRHVSERRAKYLTGRYNRESLKTSLVSLSKLVDLLH